MDGQTNGRMRLIPCHYFADGDNGKCNHTGDDADDCDDNVLHFNWR